MFRTILLIGSLTLLGLPALHPPVEAQTYTLTDLGCVNK